MGGGRVNRSRHMTVQLYGRSLLPLSVEEGKCHKFHATNGSRFTHRKRRSLDSFGPVWGKVGGLPLAAPEPDERV